MESTLKNLIDKIYEDAIQKTNQESEKILKNARAEAEKILSEAHTEANRILEKARLEAKILKESTEADLKIARDQTLVSLKKELIHLLAKKTIDTNIKDVYLDTPFLKELILKITEYWLQSGVLPEHLELILPETKKVDWENILQNTILQKLEGITITFTGLKSGFQMKRLDQGFRLDFTEEDMKQLFRSFLRKKTEEWLF